MNPYDIGMSRKSVITWYEIIIIFHKNNYKLPPPSMVLILRYDQPIITFINGNYNKILVIKLFFEYVT